MRPSSYGIASSGTRLATQRTSKRAFTYVSKIALAATSSPPRWGGMKELTIPTRSANEGFSARSTPIGPVPDHVEGEFGVVMSVEGYKCSYRGTPKSTDNV